MLSKAVPNEFKNQKYLHPNLRINSNKLCMLDYKKRVRTRGRIPIKHNDNIIFVSLNSFIQNNMNVRTIIRKNVKNMISNMDGSILGIGGESYMYIMNRKNSVFISNNRSIINDSIANNNIQAIHIDYNNINMDVYFDNVLINLSNLNCNLLKQINDICIQNIIIISCKHDDFWHKIKLLTNFNISKRVQIPDFKLGYFISITIMKRK